MGAARDEDRFETAVQRLRENWPGLVAVFRFGSSGTPLESSGSDVDLALLGAEPFSATQLWEAAQDLAALLGQDVDLVDLGRASTVMRAIIVTQGECLYCSDGAVCGAFEAHALSDYARLNEERAGILADIRERGSVFGG